MNKLKVKIIIHCAECMCKMRRDKTFKVISSEKQAAMAEAKPAIDKWIESLKGKNCKICQSIIDSINKRK